MKTRTRRYAKRQLTWLRKLPGAHLIDVTGRTPGGRRRRAGRHDLAPCASRSGRRWATTTSSSRRSTLTPAQVQTAVRPALRPGRRRRARAHASPTSPAIVARLRIFNPDGARPSCRATARARRSCTCAAPAGRTRTRSASRRSRARSGRRSPARRPAAWTWAAPRCSRRTIPSGPPDGQRRGAPAPYRFQHVAIGNPQCAIRVEDPDALDLQALGPEIEHAPIFPNRTNVSFWTRARAGRDPRADLRARRGGDAVAAAPARAAPRSRTSSAAATRR